MSIFGCFGWTKKSLDYPEPNEEAIRRERFENVMERAGAIAKADPLGLSSMIRLIAKPLQMRSMVSVAYQPRHGARAAFDLRYGSSRISVGHLRSKNCVSI